jgi:hypothetical protein
VTGDIADSIVGKNAIDHVALNGMLIPFLICFS